jgi:hypothetical protein
VKSLDDILEITDVGEGRRRRRNRFPFGHHIWCKFANESKFFFDRDVLKV